MQKTKNLLFMVLCLALSVLVQSTSFAQCAPGETTLSTSNGDFPSGQLTQWTVPAGVTEVTINVLGGSGLASFGNPAGAGAMALATLPATPGHVWNIVVAGTPGVGGGGGGTGIYNVTTDEVLIVAGGGGGGGQFSAGEGGRTSESGGSNIGKAGNGGANGNGGINGEFGGGGGGGGAFTPGFFGGITSGGKGVPTGGNGGVNPGPGFGGPGAFGFGGGGAAYFTGGGGGGGYSGGGGGDSLDGDGEGGGGGGSFVHPSGTNSSITAGGTTSVAIPGTVTFCYSAAPACDIALNNINTTNESCPGANDGSLTVSASCTTCTGIEYSIDGINFQANNTFNSLAPGPYTVTVRDTGDPGCNATDNATVNEGPTADGDNDGTPDCSDGCPADPGKIAPGVCGCGVADTDSDNDNTPDCIDQCPNDPNKYEVGLCGCGVPETGCIDACAAFNGVIDDVMNNPSTTLSNGQKNALVTKLHHAKLNFEEGDNTVAINQLNAFINQVSAQSGNKIPPALAQEWIDIAQEIIDNINNNTALCVQAIASAPNGQIDAYQPVERTHANESDSNNLAVFPNPFSNQVNLQIYLPDNDQVNLRIFNLQGQHIATLLQNEVLNAGFYQVNWDSGQLPAGIYIVQLKSRNGVIQQQISKSN